MHYGRVWLFFFDLSIIFCLLPISYIAVSADYFRTFLIVICGVESMNSSGWKIGMKFITCLCIMYPLTLIKTIKALSYVASLSLLFVFISVFFVLVRFGIWEATGVLNGVEHRVPTVQIWPISTYYIPNVIKYVCLFFSLYSMHASIICIMYEYRNDYQIPTPVVHKQIKRAIFFVTLPIAFSIYTCYGIIGALMFNQQCNGETWCIPANGNVLLSFTNDKTATIIEFIYSVVVFVSFPCLMYPIRRSVLRFTRLDRRIDVDTPKGYLYYSLVGLAITLVCLLTAVFLDDISDIQSFTANLLGIILYALSGVMLWYKRGRRPIRPLEEVQAEESPSEAPSEALTPARVDSVEALTEVREPPMPRWRTGVFWAATVLLLLLNLAALCC